MKKCRLFFVLLFLFNLFKLNAQPETYHLYVKLTMGDCLTCYGSLMYLDKLSGKIPITFVFQSMEDKRAAYFMKNRLEINMPYLTSDSLFKALSHEPGSELVLKVGNVEIKRWRLNEFDGNLPVVLASLPDSVLVNNVWMGFSDKNIILADYAYNAIYVIDKEDYAVKNSLNKEKLSSLRFIKSPETIKLIKQIQSSLKTTSTDCLRLSGMQQKGENALMGVTLFVPEYENAESITLNAYDGIIKDFEDSLKSLRFLPAEKLPDGTYFGREVLYAKGDKLIAEISNKNNGMLAEFDIEPDKISFVKSFPYLFDNYVDTLKQNVVVFKKIAYPYVLSAWSTDVWNIETGELKHLPLKQEKFYYDSLTRWVASSFEIKDAVLVNNEELRLLLYIDNTYCIKDIRLHDMQFVHEKELYIPQKRQSGVYFYGTDKLLYMSEEKLLMLYI